MKKQLFLLALATLATAPFLRAQITLTNADMPTAGLDLTINYPDSFDVSILALDNSGSGQSWDFSNLGGPYSDVTYYLSPAGTPGESEFPTASLASTYEVSDSADYIYLISNSNEYSSPGQYGPNNLIKYGQPLKLFKFPFTGSTTFDQTTSLNGASEDLTITGTVSTSVSVSGSGTVKTPLGTFPCLRVKRITEINASVLFFSIVQRDTSWEWWTNNFKSPVFRYEQVYTSFIGEESYDSYSELLTGQSVATHVGQNNEADLQVAPNPTTGSLNLTFTLNKPGKTQILVTDVAGKQVLDLNSGELSAGEQQFNINLQNQPAGIYYVCLRQNGKLPAIRQFVKQ